MRTFISLPAGIAGMAPLRFGIYTTIGCIPWTAALACAGYAVGANWQSVANGFHTPTYIIAAIIVTALAIALWRYARRRKTDLHKTELRKTELSAPEEQHPDTADQSPHAGTPR